MKLTLKIWRQTGRKDKGKFVSYPVDDVNPEMSMLECLDVLNETLIERGEEPVAFEHDCREGICGSCGGCGRVHRLRCVRGGVSQCIIGSIYRRQNCPLERPAAGGARARSSRAKHGGPDERGGIWRLHQYRRVHGCVPAGD